MSDGIPFGGTAPQFPGGLLPAELAALLGLQPDGPASPPVGGLARPDAGINALLFDGRPMGGGLNPFAPRDGGPGAPGVPVAMTEADTRQMERGMMPPDGPAARAVPLPPGRPSDADLMMPAPAPVAAGPGSGANPGPAGAGALGRAAPGAPTGAPAPQVAADGPGALPANAFDPLTGQVVAGSPQRLGAPGSAQPASVGAPGQPQAGMPDLFGKFLTGLQNPEVSNLLLNLGIGLMSQRGVGQGLAAGLKGYQEAGNNLTRQQLQQFQLQQQIAGQQAVRGALAGKGLSKEMIEAAALNPAVLSSVLAQQSKDPREISYGGNTYLVPPGGRPGPDNLLGPSSGPQAGFEADPGNPVGQRPITGGPADPAYLEKKAGATATEKFVQVEQPDGSKKPYLVGTDENGGTFLRPAPGLPEASSGGNPYATGKFNESQGKAASFSDRMIGSEQTVRKFENINKDALGAIVGGMIPNTMKSEDRQAYEQAKRSFINAQLRKESGAAIAQSEFDSAERQYFPQAGEGPAIISQKRQERQRAIEAMAREGGPAYRPSHTFDSQGNLTPFGEPRQGTTPAQPSRSQLEAEARRRGLIK